MRIAILGRTEILLNTAKLLLKNNFDIKLVVTAKAAPEYNATENDFEEFAKSINADYLCTNKINEHTELLLKYKIDIAVSMNYTSTISQKIVDCFRLGILNAHLGDLPKYRGNATPNWAIINGETNIPLCIQYMIGGELDSGNILIKKYKEILSSTKIGDIYNWLNEITPVAYLETLNKLKEDSGYILEKQSKNVSDAIRCYPRIPEDSKINWNKSNLEIQRLINASSKPFSGAYAFYNNEKVIIEDCEILHDHEKYYAIPGQVSEINRENKYVVVITGSGKLKLTKVLVNGQLVDVTDFVRSIRMRFS